MTHRSLIRLNYLVALLAVPLTIATSPSADRASLLEGVSPTSRFAVAPIDPGGPLRTASAPRQDAIWTKPSVRKADEPVFIFAQPRVSPIKNGQFGAIHVITQDAWDDVNRSDATGAYTGDGVTVAVIDGGFDTDHSMLDGAWATGEYDAIDDDTDAKDLGNGTDDDNDGTTDEGVGHGTFVASLIYAGAPDAEILPIRALDDEGNGTCADLATAIDHAVTEGVDVIVLPMLVTSCTQAVKDAIDDAVDADIAIVSSAGNSSSGPTNDSYLLARSTTVGAIDGSFAVASWSVSNADVDVYAPAGDLVVGAIGGSGADTDSYGEWDGTSFSAAFVAAAAALVKEAEPTITYTDMIDRLSEQMQTVTGGSTGQGAIDYDQAASSE